MSQKVLSEEDDYWYVNRDCLNEGDIFKTYDQSLVKLDRRVPGDGTRWYVATWSGGSWGYYDNTIEPGDLRGERMFEDAKDIE